MFYSPPSFYSPSPPIYVPTPRVESAAQPPVVVVREKSDPYALDPYAFLSPWNLAVVTSPLWVPPLLDAIDAFKEGGTLYQAEYGDGDGNNTRDDEETLVRPSTLPHTYCGYTNYCCANILRRWATW